MKIIRLESENVKRLRAVEITPDGAIVTVRGRNAQGKTSVLDSIQLALGGKGAQPPRVIRDGETSAHVMLDLEDIVVERRWTSNDKSYLEVRGKDGLKVASPQGMLDKLTGTLSFDPLAFLRYDGKKQLAMLRQLVGVDTSDLDAEHTRVYEERTLVNREVDRLRARVPAAPPAGVPDTEVSAADILAEQQRAMEEMTRQDVVRRSAVAANDEVASAERAVRGGEEEVRHIEALLAKAREDLDAARGSLEMAQGARDALVADVAALPPPPDLASYAQRIAAISQTNAAVAAKKERQRIIEEGKARASAAEALTKRLDELTAAKSKRIAEATFPVDELGFSAEGITYRGLPFEQASSAEQLKVSLAMGLALNPTLKVLLIRDGSLLDEDSLKVVAEMAAKAGAQVWVECVGKDGTGIIIEDGEVVAK